jgi:DNA-binding NtrC family response regulator
MSAIFDAWQLDWKCVSNAKDPLLESIDSAWSPECIVCDFRLPGDRDGIDLLDALQERFPDVVGILQTGELPSLVQSRAEDAGYLVMYKPVTPATLATVLGASLSGAKRHLSTTPSIR